jgi:hypothetical protein
MNAERSGRLTFIPLNRVRATPHTYPQTNEVTPLIRRLRFDQAHSLAFEQVSLRRSPCSARIRLYRSDSTTRLLRSSFAGLWQHRRRQRSSHRYRLPTVPWSQRHHSRRRQSRPQRSPHRRFPRRPPLSNLRHQSRKDLAHKARRRRRPSCRSQAVHREDRAGRHAAHRADAEHRAEEETGDGGEGAGDQPAGLGREGD